MSQSLSKHATAARFERSTVDMAADRPILERSDLVLARAHVLHTNGQSTSETVQAAERLATQLGLGATMIAHWEELQPVVRAQSPWLLTVAAAAMAAIFGANRWRAV